MTDKETFLGYVKLPMRYDGEYFYRCMVAQCGEWGRLQKFKDAENIQDAIGRHIADCINKANKPLVPIENEPLPSSEELLKMVKNQDFMFVEKEPHWISVEDELPQNPRNVLTIDGVFYTVGRYSWDKWRELNGQPLKVNHWRELPPMPQKPTSKKAIDENE